MSQELILWSKKLFITLWFVLLCYALYKLGSTIMTFFIAGFLAMLMVPLVKKWKKYRIPEWITVAAIYIVVVLLVVIVIGAIIPIVLNFLSNLINQVTSWTNQLQSIYEQHGIKWFKLPGFIESFIVENLNVDNLISILKENVGSIQSFLTNQVSSITSGGISIMSSVWGFITDTILIGIMTFFIVLERHALSQVILNLAPNTTALYLKRRYGAIQDICSTWIKATLLLGLCIFVLTYIGLHIVNIIFQLKLNNIFTLALIAGIMEFVPYIGPILSAIPGIIVALTSNGFEAGMIVLIMYIVIQQLENNFLVPYIMSTNLDLSPLFVFLIMLIAGSLGGILGMILAVPIGGVIKIFYDDYVQRKNVHTLTVNHSEIFDNSPTPTPHHMPKKRRKI